MTTENADYTFLYPVSRQFPFDEACERIVRALEQKNWQAPGIAVSFYDYHDDRERGSGQKFRMVDRIIGKDFRLWFCRVQAPLLVGRLNNIAAVTELTIPQKELHVYDDESGPILYFYVGGNWERDREFFSSDAKVLSKLHKQPRMYLRYEGSSRSDAWGYQNILYSERTFDGSLRVTKYARPQYLVHTNDSGREYDPKGNEPKFFVTAEVMEEFRKYLEEIVLLSLLR